MEFLSPDYTLNLHDLSGSGEILKISCGKSILTDMLVNNIEQQSI